MTEPRETSREEDFRDYEQRDIRDGWPYSDRDGDRAARPNAPYGTPESNFDALDNKGLEVSGDPVAEDVHGAPLPFSDETGAIADDDLEERITQLLEDDERIDVTSLEITIRDGIAHIEGSVDAEADRLHLIGLVRAVKGVREVRAEDLHARGVDSHVPRDADE